MQSAPIGDNGRQTHVLTAFALLLAFLTTTTLATAQEGKNQAGLVIQFGDGSLFTACVDLGPDGEAAGEELLRASGLDSIIDYGSGFGGGTVCKIDDEGCNFPAEKCFCQCTMKPGDPCVYWSYFYSLDGQWRYASRGISAFVIKPGDVQGWAWGEGAVGTGIKPPLLTFEQICGEPAEASPTPMLTVPAFPSASPLFTRTAIQDTPVLSLPSATMEPGLGALASPTVGSTVLANHTPTPKMIVANVEGGESAAKVTDRASSSAGATRAETSNLVIFGVLVAVLVGGLFFFRVRQGQ